MPIGDAGLEVSPEVASGSTGRTDSRECWRSVRLAAGALILMLASVALPLAAQDNYEIQVYGSALVPTARTMVELHSNFTLEGTSASADGMYATRHALHETLEITHGFTGWFEVGFYAFSSARDGYGWQWVGDHVRPRFTAPESWGLPVGLSISQEIGYQRPAFAQDTWTWEIRPIIDQQLGRWYWSVNPALERSLRGANVGRGFEFAPNAVVAVDVTRKINAALEYYASYGPITGFDRPAEREQQLFPAINLDMGADWEFNAGVGAGFTHDTDHLLVKVILGRRLGGGLRR